MTYQPNDTAQSEQCRRGKHRWTTWGNYVPVFPKFEITVAPNDALPEHVPVEAYRWRHCKCGFAERETWATNERVLFDPHGETS